jgi:hypothetical protein
MSSQNVIPLSIVLSSEMHDSMGVCNEYFLHHRCRGRHNPCCKLPWATRLKRTSFPEELRPPLSAHQRKALIAVFRARSIK